MLAVAGFFLLYRIPFGEFFGRWAQIFRHKPSARKRRRELITRRKKEPPAFLRYFTEARKILTRAGRAQEFPAMIVLTVLFAAAGVFLSVLADNVFLLPVLPVGFGLLPALYVHAREGAYIRELNENLKTAIGVVTNVYIQSEDLVAAVKSCLGQMKPPFETVFREFVAETTYIEADLPRAIRNMKAKIDSRIFREWCDVLVQCCDNRDLKYVLPLITEKADEIITVQAELDTQLSSETSHYKMLFVLALLMLPLMFLIEPEWFWQMMHSTAGRLAVMLAAAAVFGSLLYAVKTLKPIEYR